MPGKHAILPPSGATRWLTCTPSARLEESFPESSSDAAREGTLAHALAANALELQSGKIPYRQYSALRKELLEADSKITSAIETQGLVKGELDTVFKEQEFHCETMDQHISQYVAFVIEELNKAKVHTPTAALYIEHRLDMTEFVPEGFGTGDAAIFSNTELHVIDLKYGKGVRVTAENNSQMKIYALGWLAEYGWEYSIATVRLTIYQPRLGGTTTYELSIGELYHWAETELRPKALAAFAGEGDYAAGEHCLFCKAKATCKALADYNMELAKYEFATANLLTMDDVAFIIGREKQFVGWLAEVKKYAMAQALTGNMPPGYKLVAGKSDRVYKDPAKIEALILAFDPELNKEKLYEPQKLLGITKMEKLLGAKRFSLYLGDQLFKPPGAPTLVPVDDPREEFNSAARDFADIEDELGDL